MMRKYALVVAPTLLAASLAVSWASGAAKGYVTLDIPGAKDGTILSSINNSGQIVGISYDTPTNTSHGYLFSRSFRTRLDASCSMPAQGGTVPCSINNRGEIVGYTLDAKRQAHGFLLRRGVYTRLDVPAACSTEPSGINDGGQVVGAFLDSQGRKHGFLWRGGAFTTLDDPNALRQAVEAPSGTEAHGINARGQVVGTYYDRTDGRPHGFLFFGGVYTTLNAPKAGRGTNAARINNRGDVVGTYFDRTEDMHGFLLRRGVYQTLDVPHARNVTEPLGISNRNQVVGDYSDAAGKVHGFILSL